MAFDGPQTTLTNSLFPSYQRESSVNAGGWSNGNVALPFGSIPSVSLRDQDMSSYMPWSHNAHDDPYDHINCVQNIKCRNPPQTPDCDGETDLQSLVSNIVDEADSQDSFYCEGNPIQCNPIWSPKILQEELLQYFQSEAKTQNSSAFPPNYVSFGKIQEQSVDNSDDEFYKQSNGPANKVFNLTNGDRNIYTLRPQNPPPGLPVPTMANNYLSQKQRNYDGMTVNKNRGNSELMNNFPDQSDVFGPQRERNSPFIDSHSVDHYIQSNGRLTSDQYTPRDINQLLSTFHSLMAGGEQGTAYRGDFPKMHMQTARMQHEDSMAWINTSPVAPKKSDLIQIQKQPVAEYGSVQRETNGEMRKQSFKCDVPQNLPGFGPQNTDYFQQPKPLSVSLYPSNQYQNKITVNRTNMSLPINMSQYLNHHIQQGQMQNKIKPQMQKEKKRMARLFGKHFSTVPLTNSEMVQKEKKQALSQNPHFDFTDGIQTLYGENGMISTKNTRQFTPLAYSINEPRRHSSLPIKSNVSKSTAAYETGVSGMDLSGMSYNEPTGLNSSRSDTMSHSEENTYHSMKSIMTPSRMKRQRGLVSELCLYLDECYEQWRCLEKERKKTEIILSKTFLGNWTVGETNPSLLKTPPNSSRLDLLIVDQLREQARVASLLDKVEHLCSVHLHSNIHVALFRHLIAIYIVHARSKEEVIHMSEHKHQANFTEERDTLKLVVALKDLVATTSKLQTALVHIIQKALPKPKRLDQHVPMEKFPFLYDGCSFKL